MNSNGNTMATAKIRREASITAIPRELNAPSSTKLPAPKSSGVWITLFFLLSGFFILGVIVSGYIDSPGSLNSIKDKPGPVEKTLGPLATQITEKDSLMKKANRFSSHEPSYAPVIKPSSPQPLKKMPDAIPSATPLVTQASASGEVKTAALQPAEKIADPITIPNQLATHTDSSLAESKTSSVTPPAGTPQHAQQYHTVKRGETLYRLSKQYGISVDEIRRINNLKPDSSIQTDQKLLVN